MKAILIFHDPLFLGDKVQFLYAPSEHLSVDLSRKSLACHGWVSHSLLRLLYLLLRRVVLAVLADPHQAIVAQELLHINYLPLQPFGLLRSFQHHPVGIRGGDYLESLILFLYVAHLLGLVLQLTFEGPVHRF